MQFVCKSKQMMAALGDGPKVSVLTWWRLSCSEHPNSPTRLLSVKARRRLPHRIMAQLVGSLVQKVKDLYKNEWQREPNRKANLVRRVGTGSACSCPAICAPPLGWQSQVHGATNVLAWFIGGCLNSFFCR